MGTCVCFIVTACVYILKKVYNEILGNGFRMKNPSLHGVVQFLEKSVLYKSSVVIGDWDDCCRKIVENDTISSGIHIFILLMHFVIFKPCWLLLPSFSSSSDSTQVNLL